MIRHSRVLRTVVRYQLNAKRDCQQLNRIITVQAFVKEVNSKNMYEKIGSLDFGTKSIGLATTDEMKQHSFPKGSIQVKQPNKTADSLTDLHRQLQEFSAKERVRYFVVGFPLMPGSGALTPLCNHIIWSIQGMPKSGQAFTFCMWDESYTTSIARATIKTQSVKKSTAIKYKDSVAASVILRSFLHSFNGH